MFFFHTKFGHEIDFGFLILLKKVSLTFLIPNPDTLALYNLWKSSNIKVVGRNLNFSPRLYIFNYTGEMGWIASGIDFKNKNEKKQ